MIGSLLSALSSDALAELQAFVDERVADALAARDREPQQRWLTTNEAATYLGCSRRAVYMRIKRGRIPADAVKRSGRSLLFDRLALDRTLERA